MAIVLVPAYICTTMADAFDRYGIACTYYPIGHNFRIDLDDLAQKAAGFQAIYLVNYFGYGFSPDEKVLFLR